MLGPGSSPAPNIYYRTIFYSCTGNQSLFGGNKINPAAMYIYHTYLTTRSLPYIAYDVCVKT